MEAQVLHPKKVALSGKQPSPIYARLVAVQHRLEDVIRHNEGGANKDLTRFTNELIKLCEKWER